MKKQTNLAIKAELQRSQSEGFEVMFFNQIEDENDRCKIYKIKNAFAIADKKDDIPVVAYFCKPIDDEDIEEMEFVMECYYSYVQQNLKDFKSKYVIV